MLGFTRVVFIACTIGSAFSASNDTIASSPSFTVPTLIQIRDILSALEAPIISALTERLNLATDPVLYTNGTELAAYLKPREVTAEALGRYAYGNLEYPFTLGQVVEPDVTTTLNPFPPGRFHQDTYSGNPALFSFYLSTVVPLLNSTTSFFYHLDNSTLDDDAALNLDATILALLSHRSAIGKIVAESKFASDPTSFTPLIQAGNSSQIRVLLTNTTQEAGVLAQAATAAQAFSSAWVTSGAAETATSLIPSRMLQRRCSGS
ncbi:hypothetical protein EUX98_g6989 [Antrodiella citrinella]|uniref:chorismate mutase n=1 Tax=Antrodiella citrinella TaxID=2447956 RepID=A0A4S4MMY0_9APHY|nr:hypothetical protein EUX98_g6989 [Antrodiella citrinella]